ncbi:MAG: hypothetical protein WAM60_00820 [Candidatus Promineifilaceae bacterium]
MADEFTSRERLRNAIQNTTEDAACDACLSQLQEYVEAQLNGRNTLTLFPHIASHLDGCLQCAAAYARLYRLEMDAASGDLPELERPRQPDLSFLPSSPDPQPTLRQRLQAAFTQLQDGLRLQLTADLLPSLLPPPSLAVTRAAAEDERYAEQLYTLDSSDILADDIPVKLSIYRDAESLQNCLVEVTVTPVGRTWPQLADILVVLELPGLHLEQRTNHWGAAAFDQIPTAELGNLVIEVHL